MLKSLREFADAGGAVLLVTHGDQGAQFTDRSVWLEAGRVCEGAP